MAIRLGTIPAVAASPIASCRKLSAVTMPATLAVAMMDRLMPPLSIESIMAIDSRPRSAICSAMPCRLSTLAKRAELMLHIKTNTNVSTNPRMVISLWRGLYCCQ